MSDEMPLLLVLGEQDDVGVCVAGAAAGTSVEVSGGRPALIIVDEIAPGHKVALRDIAMGEPVRKYGQPIGVTSAPIRRGAHVHVHNLVSARAAVTRR